MKCRLAPHVARTRVHNKRLPLNSCRYSRQSGRQDGQQTGNGIISLCYSTPAAAVPTLSTYATASGRRFPVQWSHVDAVPPCIVRSPGKTHTEIHWLWNGPTISCRCVDLKFPSEAITSSYMKKIRIFLLLAGVLATAAPRLFAQHAVTVGTGSAAPGTTIDIPVSIRVVSGTSLGSPIAPLGLHRKFVRTRGHI
jgi:hypothetical protein